MRMLHLRYMRENIKFFANMSSKSEYISIQKMYLVHFFFFLRQIKAIRLHTSEHSLRERVILQPISRYHFTSSVIDLLSIQTNFEQKKTKERHREIRKINGRNGIREIKELVKT